MDTMVETRVTTKASVWEKLSVMVMMSGALCVAASLAVVISKTLEPELAPAPAVETRPANPEPIARLLELRKTQKRWVIELEQQPVLTVVREAAQRGEEKTSVSARAAEQQVAIAEAQQLVAQALPDTVTVKRQANGIANFIAVEGSADDLDAISRDEHIKRIYPDYPAKLYLSDLVPQIQADDSWQTQDSSGLNVTGEGVTIAIIDSGVDYTHPDFGTCTLENFPGGAGCEKFAGGYDTWDNDPDPMDDYGHGTHVAAIAASNGTTLTGVAPGAKLYAYRAVGTSQEGDSVEDIGTLSSVLVAMDMAMDPNQDGIFDDHTDIIHMSLGVPGSPDDLWSEAVANAVENGAVVTVSAGNSGPDYFSLGSPAVHPLAISVGAGCKTSQIGSDSECPTAVANFSSRGPNSFGSSGPDIVAPGRKVCAAQSSQDTIWDTYQQQGVDVHCQDMQHISISGTSMSGPAVAGVVALMKQAHPDWNVEQIENTLKGTATDLGLEPLVQGSGEVNALTAVQSENPYPTARFSGDDLLFAPDAITLTGTATDSDFKAFIVEYGEGLNPDTWHRIQLSLFPVSNGALLENFGTTAITSQEFSIRLTVIDNANQISYDYRHFLKRPSEWKAGWPQRIASDPTYQWFAPAVADLDNDGMMEIIAGSPGIFDSKVYVWDADGNLRPGWPQRVASWGGSAPALGDVDGNGDLEIVYTATSAMVEPVSAVYVWNDDGTNLNDQWPKQIPWMIVSLHSPVVSDVNQDGKDEIITVQGGAGVLHITIYHDDGSEMTGPWDAVSTGDSDPSVGDIDGDGNLEIVLLSDTTNQVYVWDAVTRTTEAGYPLLLPEYMDVGVTLSDIDMDGELEIIAESFYNNHDYLIQGGYELIPDSGKYLLDSQSNPNVSPVVSGQRVLRTSEYPSVFDVEGDNSLEVVNYRASDNSFIAREFDGSLVDGWPKKLLPFPFLEYMFVAPQYQGGAAADVDNDGKTEFIYIVNTGISLGEYSYDSRIGSFLFVMDTPGNAAMIDIGTYQYDPRRSGVYRSRCTNNLNNGVLECRERCDDGNVQSGDGCYDGAIESGWRCTQTTPSRCVPEYEIAPFGPSVGYQGSPVIDNPHVVWRNLGQNLMLHNMQTGAETVVSTSPVSDAAIQGKYVVYVRGYPSRVHIYTIGTAQDTELPNIGESVSVYGERVAWSNPSTNELYVHDIPSGQTRRVTNLATHGRCYNPVLYGETLGYYCNYISTNKKSSIEALNLVTDQVTTLEQFDLPPRVNPSIDIYQTSVVYTLGGLSDDHLVMYDLTTNNKNLLYGNEGIFYPKVSSDYVIWSSGGSLAIYNRKNGEIIHTTSDFSPEEMDLSGKIIIAKYSSTSKLFRLTYHPPYCDDGTPFGECSELDRLCLNSLVPTQCGLCNVGCPTGYSCQSGQCCKKVGSSLQCDDQIISIEQEVVTEIIR